MKWKGLEVTTLNFQELFSDYSVSVVDDIRSALLDNQDIKLYIEEYGKSDPDMLHQLRLADKISLPKDLRRSNAFLLSKILQIWEKGISLKDAESYIADRSVSSKSLEVILDLVESGFSLSKYDFRAIPPQLLDIYKWGISHNKPLWIFNSLLPDIDSDYIVEVLLLLSKGFPVDEFIVYRWPTETVAVLQQITSQVAFQKFLEYIYPSFSADRVSALLEAFKLGLNMDVLSEVVEDGDKLVPVFSVFQLDWIIEAEKEGYSIPELYDPSLGNEDMSLLVREAKFNSKKKLSGRLTKSI